VFWSVGGKLAEQGKAGVNVAFGLRPGGSHRSRASNGRNQSVLGLVREFPAEQQADFLGIRGILLEVAKGRKCDQPIA
jgi:hypothetical protein